jgi:hypothetical protein
MYATFDDFRDASLPITTESDTDRRPPRAGPGKADDSAVYFQNNNIRACVSNDSFVYKYIPTE